MKKTLKTYQTLNTPRKSDKTIKKRGIIESETTETTEPKKFTLTPTKIKKTPVKRKTKKEPVEEKKRKNKKEEKKNKLDEKFLVEESTETKSQESLNIFGGKKEITTKKDKKATPSVKKVKTKEIEVKNKEILCYEEINKTQVDLINALQRENRLLRDKNELIKLFERDLGISVIKQKDNRYWTIERRGKAGSRKIIIEISEDEEEYVATLVKIENCNAPVCFKEGTISFPKNKFIFLFYSILEKICK